MIKWGAFRRTVPFLCCSERRTELQNTNGSVSFPLVNVVGLPDGSVLVEVATSPIESHRIVLTTEILKLVLTEARRAHNVNLDISRIVEKSKPHV